LAQEASVKRSMMAAPIFTVVVITGNPLLKSLSASVA